MGMYTELVFKAELKRPYSNYVLDVLRHLFSGYPKPEIVPNHPFFETPRWNLIGRCSSYYHHPRAMSHMGEPGSWVEMV